MPSCTLTPQLPIKALSALYLEIFSIAVEPITPPRVLLYVPPMQSSSVSTLSLISADISTIFVTRVTFLFLSIISFAKR
ncbi:hypothetical protein D3C76_1558050 [compost metagenome]